AASPALGLGAAEMIAIAQRNRPELKEIAYQRRINDQEMHAALLELLPSFNTYVATNFDSNAFLLNQHWASWGAKASWNLLKVFQYPAKREVVEQQDEVLRQRELAITMAVITQVHVSRARYLLARRELGIAAEYLSVQTRLVGQMRTEAKADRISEQTLIREEMNTLVAEIRHDITYATLQSAYATLFASIGLDPYAEASTSDVPLKELAAQLRSLWFERGQFRKRAWDAVA
ncbi:MAG TPA: TolC family protein, partial [Hyphomicrobiaceae bacterium]|nr:TolC family protein [Hyphomicrobiaceae bacterium]